MNEILDRIRYSGEQLWSVLPALLGAGIIFFTGYFVARQLERWIDRWLSRMDFNQMAEGCAGRLGALPAGTVSGGLFGIVRELGPDQ